MKYINCSSKIRPRSSGAPGLIFVLGTACLFILFTFGREFVLGTSPFWQTQVDDVTQYIAGFNMYFTAPWHFPLLAFDNLNYPEGTRVTFVDAIPLYAIVLKMLLPESLAPFNPFGAWVALSFLLQGLGAWWIARELRVNSWFFLIALLSVLLTYPALMARIGHISLMSHWILLFAIALYIRNYRLGRLTYWAWTFLLVGAFYINIYLFVMASGILTATFFSLQRGLAFRDVFHFLLPFIFLAVTAFIMFLPLPPAGVTQEWGFGYYSMNLLSPFTGGKLFALQTAEVPGQYEGYNYLGLGVIIALVIAHFVKKERWTEIIGRHRALFSIFLLYTVYALSNQIYFGGQQILVLNYPAIFDGLTSQFRASGRFFWPVGYAVVIIVFFLIYQNMNRRFFAVLALILVSLQLSDLGDRYNTLRASVVRDSPKPMEYAVWDTFIPKAVNTIYFYPKFKCGNQPHEMLLPVMRYAAERSLKLNTGYIARYTPNCHDVKQEIANSMPQHSAYIFARSQYPSTDEVVKLFPESNKVHCNEIQFAHVCLSDHEEKR